MLAIHAYHGSTGVPGDLAGVLAWLSTGQVTDQCWKCSNILVDGWMDSDFDDSSWTNPDTVMTFFNYLNMSR